jgi:hypothetical protein
MAGGSNSSEYALIAIMLHLRPKRRQPKSIGWPIYYACAIEMFVINRILRACADELSIRQNHGAFV